MEITIGNGRNSRRRNFYIFITPFPVVDFRGIEHFVENAQRFVKRRRVVVRRSVSTNVPRVENSKDGSLPGGGGTTICPNIDFPNSGRVAVFFLNSPRPRVPVNYVYESILTSKTNGVNYYKYR